MDALKALLSGLCGDFQRGTSGQFVRQPILLIFDDFEQALDSSSHDLFRVKPHLLATQRAVVQAFAASSTRSRVFWTSRSTFQLPDDAGVDLFRKHLHDLPLSPLPPADSR